MGRKESNLTNKQKHEDNREIAHDKLTDSKQLCDQAKEVFRKQITNAKCFNIKIDNHIGVVSKKREWRNEAPSFTECSFKPDNLRSFNKDVEISQTKRSSSVRYRGSYMSAHVLLNLLNELRKIDKMRGLPSILSLFRNKFNKFNNTRAQMSDSIYHMTLRLL